MNGPSRQHMEAQIEANKEFSNLVHFWDSTFANQEMDLEHAKAADRQADAALHETLHRTHKVGHQYLISGPALWYEESSKQTEDDPEGNMLNAQGEKILRDEWVNLVEGRLATSVMADPRQEGINRAWYAFIVGDDEVLDSTLLNVDIRRRYMLVEAARADLIYNEPDKTPARAIAELESVDTDLADYACEYDVLQLSPKYDALTADEQRAVRNDFVAYAQELTDFRGAQAVTETEMVFAINHFGGPDAYIGVPVQHAPFSCTTLELVSISRKKLGYEVEDYEQDAEELCMIVELDQEYKDPINKLVFQRGQILTIPLSSQSIGLYFYKN